MKLVKKDFEDILKYYEIGAYKKSGEIKKNDVVSFGQVIQTTKGRYFIKILKTFNKATQQGLFVSSKLYSKNFPTCKIYKTNENNLFLNWEGKHLFESLKFGILKYAIWGFIDLKTGKMVEKEKNIDREGLERIRWLMKIDKNKFNKELE